jgi:hypothetical protein
MWYEGLVNQAFNAGDCMECGRPADHEGACYAPEALLHNLVAFAENDKREHAQYKGHWSGPEWGVVQFRHAIWTKMGCAFITGEVAVAKRQRSLDGTTEAVIAYSDRNGCDTSVHAGDVQWLLEGSR